MSQQPSYKTSKHFNNKKNNRNNRKNKKPMSNEKLRQKITKMLNKVDKDNKKKESILKINKVYGEKLQDLLKRVSNSTDQSDGNLVQAFDKIQHGRKDEMRKLKEEAKELRRKKKEESKLKRDLRKIEKETKKLLLESSRVDEFPKISNYLKYINLIIDGWNICGCDKIARKSMRGKRGSGAKRIIELLQLFRNLSDYCNDNVSITIHFDGNGKDLLLENDKINVKFSGKQEIVDDRLVRELTLRLNKIGVTCMKSGNFYKKYLKSLAFTDEDGEDNNNNNHDNNKDNDGDQEIVDKKKKYNNNKVWKKYVKNKTFSDDSSSSSSSDSDFN